MKHVSITIAIALALIAGACNSTAVTPVATTAPAEPLSLDQAEKLVCTLPEITAFDKLCQSVKDEQVFMTFGPEDDQTLPMDGWWHITLGEDHTEHWLPFDRFRVDAVTREIQVLDFAEDVYVPLDRWPRRVAKAR